MPITYQRLENSGGGMDLEITSYPNAETTLSNEKYTRTVVADEKGKAVFKNLKSGKYTVTTNGKSKEITVFDRQYDYLCEQIKEIEIGSKLKLTNGKKLILMIKNASGHEANTATFVSEFITDKTKTIFNFSEDSTLVQILKRYASELADKEKTIIKEYDYHFSFDQGGANKAKSQFYILSLTELGLSGGTSGGAKLGFNDDTSRIKKYEGGSAGIYFTRDGREVTESNGAERYDHYCVSAAGKKVAVGAYAVNGTYATAGIVPACDISQDAYVTLDDDGYYRILGM